MSEAGFIGADGIELFTQSWLPDGPPRAVLALVHGFGEHSGRYSTLVEHLVRSRYAVMSFDHRGHGRSPGRRGHIMEWREYREDVLAFLEYVRLACPGTTLFLYGHSLGGLIVSEYVLWYPQGLAGLIVSGNPLRPASAAKPHLIALSRILSRIWPTFAVTLSIDGSALTRDPKVAKAYESDPLVHSRATVRWGSETLAAIDRVRARATEIRLPILIVHGESDRVNSVEGSRELFDTVSSQDKEIRIYPGGMHEPHNDIDREQVASDVVDWLDRHTGGVR